MASRARARASRSVQVARSAQSTHLRKPSRGETQGASASGPSMMRMTYAKVISLAGRARTYPPNLPRRLTTT